MEIQFVLVACVFRPIAIDSLAVTSDPAPIEMPLLASDLADPPIAILSTPEAYVKTPAVFKAPPIAIPLDDVALEL